MSTKSTISFNKNYHLYEDVFDKDKVYLDLNCGTGLPSITVEYGKAQASLAINIDVWRSIVEAWTTSHWGQNKHFDYSTDSDD